MFKKYFILSGIISALLLFLIATIYYPGGSVYDKNAVGFDWKNNYITNLFGEKAVNGFDNLARPWAIAAMLVLSVSIGVFFVQFSKKIMVKRASNIIRYFGVGAMVCAFLTVTPYHDLMVALAVSMALLSMFYITVFIFKSKLLFFKILSVACLLVFYSSNYIYYANTYTVILPTMQKLTFLMTIIWALGLEYFTDKKDFEAIK